MAGELQPIQIRIQANGADEATKSILGVVDALKQLQSVSKQVTNTGKIMSNFGNTKVVNNFSDFTNSTINSNNKLLKKTAKSSKSLGNGFNFVKKSGLGMLAALFAVERVIKILRSALDESASWVENLNVMEVSFGNLSEDAYKFVSSVAGGFGLDKNELLEYASLFQQMASAMGQTTETAYMMSTALTLVGTDVSSLYNKDIKVTMEALRSAIAGQVKPVRQFGFDITSYSIDGLIEQMGILEGYTSRMMTQSQKQLARTILLIQQSKNAWGDLGKTLDTYSNQQKILSAQFTNLKRAIGDLFIGTIQNGGIATKMLYAINGAMMAIVETIRVFIPEATSSGVNEVNKDLENMEENIENVEDTMNGALLSFDEFNTLSQGGEKGQDWITSKLELKLAEEYNNYLKEWQQRMEAVSSKAHEIRDSIMEWLGFTKQINETTQKIENDPNTTDDDVYITLKEVEWTLGEGQTKASIIRDIFKEILDTIKYISKELNTIFGKFLSETDFKENITETFNILRRALSMLLDADESAIPALFEKILYLVNAILPPINQLATVLLDVIEEILSNEELGVLFDRITDLVTVVLPTLVKNITPVINIVGKLITALLNVILPIVNDLLRVITNIVAVLDKYLTPITTKIGDFVAWLIEGIGKILEFVLMIAEIIMKVVGYLLENLVGGLGDFFKSIGNHFRGKSASRNGMFANGGYPDEGSMFIANERGPELVGNIGGRTAVANNDMIVQAIENAAFRGMTLAMAGGGTNNVNLKIDANPNDLSRALAKSMVIELQRQGYKI